MNLALFVHQDTSQQGEALQKQMARYFGKNTIQMVHTFNALKHILKQPLGCDQEAYVLLAESPRRLKKLFCRMENRLLQSIRELCRITEKYHIEWRKKDD